MGDLERAVRYRDTLLELGKAHGNEALLKVAADVHDKFVMTGIGLTTETERGILQAAADAFQVRR